MSDRQWSALMLGDESYAGCRSFYKLKNVIADIFDMPYMQPTHQGRGADSIMAQIYVKPGTYAIGNMHFDTFRGNAEIIGATAVDCATDSGMDAASPASDFKGNLDLNKMECLVEEKGIENISLIVVTVTCNNNGGQPVSMENLRAVRAFAERYKLPVVFDSARFAENAYFIKMREPGYEDKTIREIVREMFSYCDTMTMSSKKDGLVNMGGFLATRDKNVLTQANQLAIVHEGFLTYGGMSGRDMEALAVGLEEVCEFSYLDARVKQVEYLGHKLIERGIPIVVPVGGHGVYVDGRRFFPHIPQHQFPSQRLVCALYEEAGVRAVELGACAFGHRDPITKEDIWPSLETMRIAISRRVYTNSHMDVIANALGDIFKNRDAYRGMRIVHEGEVTSLRHFTVAFAML
jgi:tryptophanase